MLDFFAFPHLSRIASEDRDRYARWLPSWKVIHLRYVVSTLNPATPLNVFTVEEYDAPTGKNGTSWTKIGVAFPHHEGPGFNIELRAFPRNGRLVVLAPSEEERQPRERAG
jgi:hypothetical protein